MSWDDVQIGKRHPHCGAITVPRLSTAGVNVSENRDEYWIQGVLGLEGRIEKTSKEGKELTARIADGRNPKTVGK